MAYLDGLPIYCCPAGRLPPGLRTGPSSSSKFWLVSLVSPPPPPWPGWVAVSVSVNGVAPALGFPLGLNSSVNVQVASPLEKLYSPPAARHSASAGETAKAAGAARASANKAAATNIVILLIIYRNLLPILPMYRSISCP